MKMFWMNEWMFNDTPAQKINQLLGAKTNGTLKATIKINNS